MAELEPEQVVPGAEIVEVASTAEVVPGVGIVETDAAAGFDTIVTRRARSVYAGMWGPLEIGAVSAGALAILVSLLVYFFVVVPSNRQLAQNRSEADRLDAEVTSAKTKYGEITDTQTQVTKIVSSIDDFEMRFLPVVSTGQSALYQRINGLIGAYGLVNTTGPDYAPLETVDSGAAQQTDEEKGRSKFRSIYPGVYVSTTVEGTYQNVRRFIREIETGRDFIIVSAVEIGPSDSQKQKSDPAQVAQAASPTGIPTNPYAPAKPGGYPAGVDPNLARMQAQSQSQPQVRRPQGKTRGDIVSLRIEMAAYFRRPNFSPVQPAQ